VVARRPAAQEQQEVGEVGRQSLAPLTGAAFVVLVIVSFIVAGEPPEASNPVGEVVDFYVDNDSAIRIGAALTALAGVLLLFFAGYLRAVLKGGPGGDDMLPTVALIGAGVLATGAALDATILFALAEAADDIDPTAVQALQALWDNDFLPLALGGAVFILASGLSILTRATPIPRWLGWVAALLGLIGLTPIGFVGFLGSAIWIVIVSVLLALRARPKTAAG
jgi:hypothetical protein